VRFDRLGDVLDLFGGEEQHLRLRGPWDLQTAGRVRLDRASVDGDLEHVAGDLRRDANRVRPGTLHRQPTDEAPQVGAVELADLRLSEHG
jgi:hypothetical protein